MGLVWGAYVAFSSQSCVGGGGGDLKKKKKKRKLHADLTFLLQRLWGQSSIVIYGLAIVCVYIQSLIRVVLIIKTKIRQRK